MTVKSILKTFLTLIGSLGICLLAGYMGWYPALPGMPAWYAGLVKPVFSPPSWVFSSAWIISFILMGFTLFLILEAGTRQHDVALGLILFIAQLLFTIVWAYTFFGTHAIFFAFLFMVALFATLLCAVIQIFRFSVTGGMLMIPYLVWVFYLAYLNYGMMTLNKISFGF
jgi:benzodiazapine receptor